MALMPKRVKHRKVQRGRIKGNATRGNTVAYGEWGLQSLEAGHIAANTIEACRIAATQYVRGEGKLYIRIFPDKPVTARPLETRMGKGKGEPDHWVAVIKPGTILFELTGVGHDAARDCFARVAYKLPLKVRLVARQQTV
ncbi:50S ribosomal protein L16 [Thalassoroseus pseudoceratinae]|uniref:50S ribosomal protein L16 n=1 Tax=Thalassoroseus pseudoceratinae TaxID=2713176 RepID=UPI00142268AD|nr:50S ribosomal protein L16 [Thalassoroseus pseudoceratinae]